MRNLSKVYLARAAYRTMRTGGPKFQAFLLAFGVTVVAAVVLVVFFASING
jgi:hypothetical protein